MIVIGDHNLEKLLAKTRWPVLLGATTLIIIPSEAKNPPVMKAGSRRLLSAVSCRVVIDNIDKSSIIIAIRGNSMGR